MIADRARRRNPPALGRDDFDGIPGFAGGGDQRARHVRASGAPNRRPDFEPSAEQLHDRVTANEPRATGHEYATHLVLFRADNLRTGRHARIVTLVAPDRLAGVRGTDGIVDSAGAWSPFDIGQLCGDDTGAPSPLDTPVE